MKTACLLVTGVFVAAFAAAAVAVPAQAKTKDECNAEWAQMKADKKTAGMKKRDFTKQCMGGDAAAAAEAPKATAGGKSKEDCDAEWKQMKADKKTAGMHKRDFTKQCMAGTPSGPAAEAPKSAEPAPKSAEPAPKTGEGEPTAKPSGGREAEYARERACGKEWKADKAAGKIPEGMKWPQYWSECNKRKKAAGM